MELFSYVKRKSRFSSSDSDTSTKETPEIKRSKFEDDPEVVDEASAIELSPTSCQGEDKILLALDMAQDNASKTDIILSKLGKLDTIALEIQSLRESVEKINFTVEKLQHDFSLVERDLKKVITDTDELQESVTSLNKDVEEGKANLEQVKAKSEEELQKLRLQLLDYEVYQRRENLRFYGVREERDEDTKETLYNFLENELGISGARRIEFQRVHRTGKKSGKPRSIIPRFLRYTDREAVFTLRSSLEKDAGFGIGPDLPKQVVEMRKKLIPKMLDARKQGKRAAFSRAEPYKLIIDGEQFI